MNRGESKPNYQRHDWIKARLKFLVDVFALDLLAFAIMGNHTHIVLRANVDEAKHWSNKEVLSRWAKLGRLPTHCKAYLDEQGDYQLNEFEVALVVEDVEKYRERLCNISVFMSSFNYYIAKRANKEDGVTGHFWDARFKSQALLDDKAVLACMAYVDLNPVRAGIYKQVLGSPYTSVYERVMKTRDANTTILSAFPAVRINPLDPLPFEMSLREYINYLESLCDNPETIDRVDAQMQELEWQEIANNFESTFKNFAGSPEAVESNEKRIRCAKQSVRPVIQDPTL